MFTRHQPFRKKQIKRLEERQRSYRTLKLAFAQFHSVREEQEFGRLEMKSEIHSMCYRRRWGKAVFLTSYGILSGYGYSAKRPAGWLVGLFAVGFSFSIWPIGCSCEEAVRLSLANTLPPFAISADIPQQGFWFVWFGFQRILSYLLWFLIALAWRNQTRFK